MKAIATTRHRRLFAVLHTTRTSQAAMMTLAPGAESNERSANEHGWAEQWLFVVRGTGTARIGKRTVPLRAGTLLLIGRREPHVIPRRPSPPRDPRRLRPGRIPAQRRSAPAIAPPRPRTVMIGCHPSDIRTDVRMSDG